MEAHPLQQQRRLLHSWPGRQWPLRRRRAHSQSMAMQTMDLGVPALPTCRTHLVVASRTQWRSHLPEFIAKGNRWGRRQELGEELIGGDSLRCAVRCCLGVRCANKLGTCWRVWGPAAAHSPTTGGRV